MVLMPSVSIDTVNHHQNERLVVYADDVGQSEFPKVFLHVSVRANPGCLLHFDPKHHGAGLVASHLLALQLIQVDKKHIFFPQFVVNGSTNSTKATHQWNIPTLLSTLRTWLQNVLNTNIPF